MNDEDRQIKTQCGRSLQEQSSAGATPPAQRSSQEDGDLAYVSDDAKKLGAVKVDGPRICKLSGNAYDSAVVSLDGGAIETRPPAQAAVFIATLVGGKTEDIEERIQRQLKEKEAALMEQFAAKEEALKKKEEAMKNKYREAGSPNAHHTHVDVDCTSACASVSASMATTDSGSSWSDFTDAMFAEEEIKTNKLIASGNFNSVFDIKLIKLGSQVYWWTHNEHSHRRQLIADSSKKSKFVIKMLNGNLEPRKKELAGKRLVYEARLVSQFSHEHVISLLGLPSPDAPGPHFFFLMHEIQETLWQYITKSRNKRQRGNPKFMLKQAEIATAVASGLDYIHARNIMFSDLKPEVCVFSLTWAITACDLPKNNIIFYSFYFFAVQNIGFNNAGVLKLFNFSKAQSLTKKKSPSKPYDISLTTKSVYHGTRPYAAPEIVAKIPCNISVDTYAFAIVLWELTSLKICFGREMKGGNTFDAILDECNTHTGGQRPNIEEDTPTAIGVIIRQCWGLDPRKRPCMRNVYFQTKQYQDTLKMAL